MPRGVGARGAPTRGFFSGDEDSQECREEVPYYAVARALGRRTGYFSTVMANAARSRGRPAHEPDGVRRRFVEVMAGAAVPQAEIAAVIGVTEPTLRRHYRRELDRGAARVQVKLVGNLLRIANGTGGTALKAIIFSLQSRFGWSKYAPPPPR